MPPLQLLLLGPVRLETADGKSIVDVGLKGRALLAYLAAQPGGRAERDRLAGLLWDSDQAQARHALRQTLLVLRRKLGPYVAQALANDGSALSLRLNAIEVDLLSFEAGIRSGDHATLASACSLWRGRFCDGLDIGAEAFEEWLAIERARLDDAAADAFRRLTQERAESGAFTAAVESARQLVQISPFDDKAHATLIALYRRRGWVGPAQVAYRRCVKLFQRELGERPSDDVDAALRIPIEPDRRSAGPRTPLPPAPALAAPFLRYARVRTSRGASVLVAAVVTAVIVVGGALSILDRLTGASTPEPRGLAWVGLNERETLVSDGDAFTVPVPVPVPPGSAERPTMPTRHLPLAEEVIRALELDPRYAHLYPVGC